MTKTAHLTCAAALSLMALPTLADTINGDLTVRRNLCVGNSCANGGSESFSNQRLRIKDVTTWIDFEDSSGSGFTTNDWRLRVNDAAPGTENYFAIEDLDGGTTPFRVDAGAPGNALRVANSGNVGLGTGLPARDLHIINTNTPTLRLEQSAASGLTPYTWDVVGNETGFIVRDMLSSGGVTAPFIVQPNSGTQALVTAPGGVGIGTDSPQARLHVAGQSMLIKDNGRVNFTLSDTSNAGPDFRTQLSGGSARFSFVGSGVIEMKLSQGGDLEIAGNYISSGTTLSVPDYVFADDYALRPLAEVQSFIDTHSHLPEVPSAAQIAADGLDMSEMQMTLLKKIEELTLYTLEQEAKNQAQEAKLAELDAVNATLVAEIAALKAAQD